MGDLNLYNQIMQIVLATEANNKELLAYIDSHKDAWRGPELINESLIKRTVGPEPEMLNFESETQFDSKVKKIQNWLTEHPDEKLSLLCEKHEGLYYLLDGNHRFEALKNLGHQQFSVIFTEDSVIHNLINRQE